MIRGQVLGGSRVLPTEEIFAAALRVQDSLPTSHSSQPVETSALIASGGAPRASGKSTSSGKTRNSYPSCKYCGKPTHPLEKCWKEFGKPAWALAASGGKASSTTSPVEGSSSTTTPRLRERSASRYLPQSSPTFRHPGPPHFVRLRHHQPVLQH